MVAHVMPEYIFDWSNVEENDCGFPAVELKEWIFFCIERHPSAQKLYKYELSSN